MVHYVKEAISQLDIFGALRICSKSRNLEKGKQLHSIAIQSGDISDIHVASSLVDMYAKCGKMHEARRVFDEMNCHDVVAWTALIMGYADHGEEQVAIFLFSQMDCLPNPLTFVAVLKACTKLAVKEKGKPVHGKLRKVASLWKGMVIHSHAASRHFDADLFVASALVDMYAKCGSIFDGERVFHCIRYPDVVCWNALIFGYLENGEAKMALDSFTRMKCAPNALTIVGVVKACTCLGKQALMTGMIVHSNAISKKLDKDARVACTLIDMYANCGCLVDAFSVFDRIQIHTVVSWTAMMFGYAENNKGNSALELFLRMSVEGCLPNALTFVAALKACCDLAAMEGKDGQLKDMSLEKGMGIHFHAASLGFASDIRVRNSLIDMYSSCGSMNDAAIAFEISKRSNGVISWNALIFGRVENGHGDMALELFSRMEREGCEPDILTFVAAFKACGMVGALEYGRKLHADIVSQGLSNETILVSALVDFYGRCGAMTDAQAVFDSSDQCLVVLTALMTGYSRNGDIQAVLKLFEKMLDLKIEPDGVVFLCVLTACSHAGLVEKGKAYFDSMYGTFKMKPGIEHYHCMVDILGRANHVEEAFSLVKDMPYTPNAVTWTTLLGACRKWKDVEVAKAAFDGLLNIDSNDPGIYTLMANIYHEWGMQQQQNEMEALRSKVLCRNNV